MTTIFNKKGLYIEDEWISEFEPKVIGVKKHIYLTDGTQKKTYEVIVTKLDESKTEVKEVDSLSDISYFGLWSIPDGMLTNKQKKLLNYKLQQDVVQLKKEQIKTIIEVGQGLYNYKNLRVYGFGDKVFKNNRSETEEAVVNDSVILVHNDIDLDWSRSLRAYINLFPGVSEMVFYGSLLGAIKPIICDAGFKLEFAISLIGPSGHLKTSMVRKYALWLEDSEMQEISFRNHRRNSSIVAMVDRIPGQNFLLDDLHESKAADVSTRQQEKLDFLVRHIGEHKNSANLFVTGETMKKMGIFSCKDRILQIKIPRKNSEELRELKRNIGLLSAGYMGNLATLFLESLMKNYDEVIKRIQEYMVQSLDKEDVSYDTRTYSHGIFIKLTEMLFKKYMCGNLSNIAETDALDKALKKNYEMQQKELQREEEIDYAVDVYKMLMGKDNYLAAITNGIYYDPGKFDNYMWKDGKAYVTKEALAYGMRKYYGRSVSWKEILNDLDEKALLDKDCDRRSKKFMNKRHIVILIDALKGYVKWKQTMNESVMPS